MLSRATSLDGVVILTPFAHERIAFRQIEDVQLEFRRLTYLALQTIVEHGTEEEARRLESSFIDRRPIADAGPTENDPCDHVIRIERANAAPPCPAHPSRSDAHSSRNARCRSCALLHSASGNYKTPAAARCSSPLQKTQVLSPDSGHSPIAKSYPAPLNPVSPSPLSTAEGQDVHESLKNPLAISVIGPWLVSVLQTGHTLVA
ncbi:hypothetical protein B0H16DRAFT_1717369 [Mycena metata]|uniref:Uncharacterized protein n=1 Tax=Mycena metata TaxID=1033252 RepID=A0AAD7NM97_9AGAR|nr:hypothetical protein B0H16DRAFT_1717369 [Mycena metata]